jgi:cell wall-associated NlpC family hydrolase
MRRRLSSRWIVAGTLALAAASAACASSGAVPKPFPRPGGWPSTAPAPSAPADPEAPVAPASPSPPAVARANGNAARSGLDGYALVGTALALRGIPYRNGGSDPSGFDCSGFIQYVFSQYGVALPREVREQYRVGKSVKPEDLAPGDIVFFSTTEPGPSHVAIAIGGDEFVHAPSATGVVRVEHLGSTYWAPRFLAVRRVGD